VHFANLDGEHKSVAVAKELIVKEAESLANSKDWLNTAKRFKSLMDQWKASGRGKKSSDTALWNRFKIAQDSFFTAKNSDMKKRKGSMVENLSKREALVSEFEALLPITDFKPAKKKFNDLMDKYQRIGMTDRKKKSALDSKIKKVEDEAEAAGQTAKAMVAREAAAARRVWLEQAQKGLTEFTG